MRTSQLHPTAREMIATSAIAFFLLSLFCTTAFTQNVADPAARKRPSAKTTPIILAPQAQLILDPGFEAGDPWPAWTTQISTNFGTPLCDAACGNGGGSSGPFAGNDWAWFGGASTPENSTIGQVVTIPNGVTASLSFQLRIGSVSSPFTDTLTVKIDGTTLQTFTEPAAPEAAYTLRTFNVSAFADGAPHTVLFTYVGPTNGISNFTVDDVNLNTTTGSPLLLTSAVSRKTHTGVGAFDIALPLSSPFGIECRSGVAGHTFVFNFSNTVVMGSASVTTGVGGVSGSPTFSGNTMTVNLTGVADAQLITVTLSGVMDTFGQVLPSTAVSARILLGDTNNSGAVSNADISQTKAQAGNVTNAGNFRTDTNLSGSISNSDVSQVKAQSGHSVP